MLAWIVLILVVGFAAYVRLAPTDVAAVHQPVSGGQDHTGPGSALRVLETSEGALSRADAAMMAEPATHRIAGSVQEGRISYVSRSRWWGFPDYTTIEDTEGQIRMFARLRFGQRDFGVNAARLGRIKRAVEPGG